MIFNAITIMILGPGVAEWLRHCATSRRVSGSIAPIPVDERFKAYVCGRSLAGVAGSNPAGGMDVCVVCVVQ